MEFFPGIDGRFTVSMTDSTMMCILHSAMNKAHDKVRSKDGVIERLNEQSKFCELAIMQLEACLRFVQDEAGSHTLESTYDKLMSDLTDIKNRLHGRLKETENALAEKDKELMERIENEARLRQALEAKEKELEALRSMRNEDEKRGDFCELKNSVDQQFLNIKQHLEGEKIALSRRMSQGSSVSTILDDSELLDVVRDHSLDERLNDASPIKSTCEYDPELEMGFDQMRLEIDKLKETLDTAFGVMQSTPLGFDIHPLEVQWTWMIEKDIQFIFFKEFMKDLNDNFHGEVRIRDHNLPFIGLPTIEKWSQFMNAVTLMCNEPEGLVCSNEAVAKDEELKKPVDEGLLEEERSNFVVRMVKNHGFIVREKCEELNIESSSRKERDQGSLKKGIDTLIKRLDGFLEWKAKLNQIIENNSVNNEKAENAVDLQYVSTLEDNENETRTIEQQIEDSNLQFMVREEIYNCLFKGLMKDFEVELDKNNIKNSAREGICMNGFKAMVKELKFCSDERATEGTRDLEENDLNQEERKSQVFLAKPEENTSNMVLKTCDSNSHLESLVHEEVQSVFLAEVANSRVRELEDNKFENLIGEDVWRCVFLETLKDCQAGKTPGNIEVNGKESLIEMLDYLLSDIEIEDFLIKGPEEREEIEYLDIVSSETEEKDVKNTYNVLTTEDEVIFSEVSNKLESVLERLGATKTLLKELGYNEETTLTSENVFEEVYDQIKYELWSSDEDQSQSLSLQNIGAMEIHRHNYQNDSLVDPGQMISMSPKPREAVDLQAKLSDSNVTSCPVFFQVLLNFKGMLQQKLNVVNSRLEKVNDQVKPLIQHIISLKKEKSLYKKAFIRRCQNLQKAEAEVDVLGDQVNSVTCLLERIYSTLDYYSPVLQHFSGVLDILIWIRKELNLGVAAHTPKHVF